MGDYLWAAIIRERVDVGDEWGVFLGDLSPAGVVLLSSPRIAREVAVLDHHRRHHHQERLLPASCNLLINGWPADVQQRLANTLSCPIKWGFDFWGAFVPCKLGMVRRTSLIYSDLIAGGLSSFIPSLIIWAFSGHFSIQWRSNFPTLLFFNARISSNQGLRNYSDLKASYGLEDILLQNCFK
ncbi:hypothetical protein CEXT_720901 [Caerostris extrusa]|uniref:Uncharacterized protein n=1 Tax=Caerostris extrusa TaxID=172846 RepID=A0AAV4QZ23_CAEEX|nr:hypothetical protein CEXT_720901 [Caerostris extrusa]